MTNTEQASHYGKPWSVSGRYNTYEQAFADIQQLLAQAANSGAVLNAKIKKTSDGRFVIKTRNETPKPAHNRKTKKKKKG